MDLEKEILKTVTAVDYAPMTAARLARQLAPGQRGGREFHDAIARLIEQGRIRQDRQGRIRPRGSTGSLTGLVRKINSGAAFVIPDRKSAAEVSIPGVRAGQGLTGDIYISARDLGDAQTGDEVQVRITAKRRSGGQRCGVVERILQRATSVFVGTYSEKTGKGFVQIDGSAYPAPVSVGDPGARGAVPGDKVVVEMLRFPTATRHGEAVVTEVLGKRGDPGIDTITVIRSLGLPDSFPDDALTAARQQAEEFREDDLRGRIDLTQQTIITIDPIDARDFDDAISLTKSDEGHWQLGVHIADVAHFVPAGSPLDREAAKRGTSVYLPRRVIPMLPELISNGLASLQQGQVRYTKSVLIEFDRAGSVVGSDIVNSAIKVTRRFAYEEVMPILRDPRRQVPGVTAPVRQLLTRMHELAMLLRRRRFEQGALQMGIPEIEIDFDTSGNVTGAHERHHDESHEIIEEFMLAANITVARTLESRRLAYLRRVHGTPDELKMRNFEQFCRGLGITIQKCQSRKELQDIIHRVSGQPEERAVNFALLRSMKQAEYSPDNIGHYALAEEDYCHFTSPIRRYPDLTIHRLIGRIADGKRATSSPLEELVQLGKHCSLTERRAERAERELIRLKLLRYMAERIGEEMDAFITGVEGFGLFCQGIEIPAEGVVHLSTLTDDFYVFDQTARTLAGSRSRREYRLGDRVRVSVAAVDIDRRQLDFRLIAGNSAPARPAAKRGSRSGEKSQASKKTRRRRGAR